MSSSSSSSQTRSLIPVDSSRTITAFPTGSSIVNARGELAVSMDQLQQLQTVINSETVTPEMLAIGRDFLHGEEYVDPDTGEILRTGRDADTVLLKAMRGDKRVEAQQAIRTASAQIKAIQHTSAAATTSSGSVSGGEAKTRETADVPMSDPQTPGDSQGVSSLAMSMSLQPDGDDADGEEAAKKRRPHGKPKPEDKQVHTGPKPTQDKEYDEMHTLEQQMALMSFHQVNKRVEQLVALKKRENLVEKCIDKWMGTVITEVKAAGNREVDELRLLEQQRDAEERQKPRNSRNRRRGGRNTTQTDASSDGKEQQRRQAVSQSERVIRDRLQSKLVSIEKAKVNLESVKQTMIVNCLVKEMVAQSHEQLTRLLDQSNLYRVGVYESDPDHERESKMGPNCVKADQDFLTFGEVVLVEAPAFFCPFDSSKGILSVHQVYVSLAMDVVAAGRAEISKQDEKETLFSPEQAVTQAQEASAALAKQVAEAAASAASATSAKSNDQTAATATAPIAPVASSAHAANDKDKDGDKVMTQAATADTAPMSTDKAPDNVSDKTTAGTGATDVLPSPATTAPKPVSPGVAWFLTRNMVLQRPLAKFSVRFRSWLLKTAKERILVYDRAQRIADEASKAIAKLSKQKPSPSAPDKTKKLRSADLEFNKERETKARSMLADATEAKIAETQKLLQQVVDVLPYVLMYARAVPSSNQSVSLGYGIFPMAFSYINHSCRPNCTVWGMADGHVVVSRCSAESILSGEEITVSYVPDLESRPEGFRINDVSDDPDSIAQSFNPCYCTVCYTTEEEKKKPRKKQTPAGSQKLGHGLLKDDPMKRCMDQAVFPIEHALEQQDYSQAGKMIINYLRELRTHLIAKQVSIQLTPAFADAQPFTDEAGFGTRSSAASSGTAQPKATTAASTATETTAETASQAASKEKKTHTDELNAQIKQMGIPDVPARTPEQMVADGLEPIPVLTDADKLDQKKLDREAAMRDLDHKIDAARAAFHHQLEYFAGVLAECVLQDSKHQFHTWTAKECLAYLDWLMLYPHYGMESCPDLKAAFKVGHATLLLLYTLFALDDPEIFALLLKNDYCTENRIKSYGQLLQDFHTRYTVWEKFMCKWGLPALTGSALSNANAIATATMNFLADMQCRYPMLCNFLQPPKALEAPVSAATAASTAAATSATTASSTTTTSQAQSTPAASAAAAAAAITAADAAGATSSSSSSSTASKPFSFTTDSEESASEGKAIMFQRTERKKARKKAAAAAAASMEPLSEADKAAIEARAAQRKLKLSTECMDVSNDAKALAFIQRYVDCHKLTPRERQYHSRLWIYQIPAEYILKLLKRCRVAAIDMDARTTDAVALSREIIDVCAKYGVVALGPPDDVTDGKIEAKVTAVTEHALDAFDFTQFTGITYDKLDKFVQTIGYLLVQGDTQCCCSHIVRETVLSELAEFYDSVFPVVHDQS